MIALYVYKGGNMDNLNLIDSPAVIAERLRQALAVKHKKQSELAESTGFSRVYVNQLVRGKKEFYSNDTHLRKIAIALEINPGWLIRGTGTMESAEYQVEGNATRQVNLDKMHVISVCKVIPQDDPADVDYMILENEESIALPKSVCNEGIQPFALKVDTDLIAPIISTNDYAILRKESGPVIDGKLYAIWYMNRVHFRYITVNINGNYTLSTTSDGVRADVLNEEQSRALVILGRVIARVGSVI